MDLLGVLGMSLGLPSLDLPLSGLEILKAQPYPLFHKETQRGKHVIFNFPTSKRPDTSYCKGNNGYCGALQKTSALLTIEQN